jgi:hypothetical protein
MGLNVPWAEASAIMDAATETSLIYNLNTNNSFLPHHFIIRVDPSCSAFSFTLILFCSQEQKKQKVQPSIYPFYTAKSSAPLL